MINFLLLVVFFFFSGCVLQKKEVSQSVPEVKYWNLSNGSHIAYINYPSNDSLHSIPIIFLHGGPGAYQVASGKTGKKWYEKLNDYGFSIYLYDQIGSGLSARLNRPEEYSVRKHIEDLEAIRKIIGNEKVVLIGDSWGATLLSNYIAVYPDKVLKAVFTSPGPMDFGNWNLKSDTPRLSPEFLFWLKTKYGENKYQRFLKLDSLLQTDLSLAHQFADDAEMDTLADNFINDIILPNCIYDKEKLKETELKLKGCGWWVMIMTIWDATNNNELPKDKLKNLDVPVLILRGNSDYLPEGIADEYQMFFKNSKNIKIPLCGHFIWLDQPKIYSNQIEYFLTN